MEDDADVATPRDRLARAPRRVRRAVGRHRSAQPRPGSAESSRSAPGSTLVARRSRSRRSTTASTPRSESTRTRRRRPKPAGWTSCASCSAHPKAVAVGETGLDNVKRYATPAEQRRLFDAQLALADELGLPVVVHSREAARTRLPLSKLRGRRDPPLLLVARSAAGCARARVLRLVRGQRDVSEGGGASRGRRGRSRGSHPGGDGQPVPLAAAGARTAKRARAPRPHDRARWQTSATRTSRGSPPPRTRTQPLPSGCRERDAEEGARPALPRRREHPRRHRTPRRRSTRTTWCSRSGRGSAC